MNIDLKDRSKLIWMALIALAIVLLRLPSLWTPIIDMDEAIFANIANRWLTGGIPYVDMVDNKPMGIFYFYAAVFALFGHGNMIAVHIVTMLVIAVTCYCIYKISDFLKPGSVAGFWAALCYAVFTTTFVPKMIATEIEPVMMLPLTIGIYLWLKGENKTRGAPYFLASGFFSGVGIILKYQAGINLVVILVYWLFVCRGRNISRIILFLLGYAAAPAIMVSHLYLAGALEAFKIWTLQESAYYIASGFTALDAVNKFLVKGFTCMLCGYILWIVAFWALIRVVREKTGNSRYLVAIWFLLSWIPVFTGFRFYGHYFIQLMPAAAILGGTKLEELWGRRPVWRYFIALSFIVPAVFCSIPRYMTDTVYKMTGEDNVSDYKPVAEYIKARTSPGDFIYVWGWAPSVYYFSERKSSSRFPYTNQLVGHMSDMKITPEKPVDTSKFVLPFAWDMFWEDFGKHPPEFIIDTATPNFHKYSAYPIKNYPQFEEYLRRNYTYDTTVNGAPVYRRAVN